MSFKLIVSLSVLSLALLTGSQVLAATVLSFSMLDSAHIQVGLNVKPSRGLRACVQSIKSRFDSSADMTEITRGLYRQLLRSDVDGTAVYLKAARQGNGVYIHLPYFMADASGCAQAEVEIKARHVLWNGRWVSGGLKIPAQETVGRSVFLSEEEVLPLAGEIYLDPTIGGESRARLSNAMARVLAVYEDGLGARPLRDVGVVVSIVHNGANYTGFGGDSLNIVRLSYDNPSPRDLERVDQTLSSVFAHELAHKLQREQLLSLPLGRFVTEGGAEFLKIVVLLSAELISEDEAHSQILKAFESCQKLSDAHPNQEKYQSGKLNYRAPYDCGLSYYFQSYSGSGLGAREFVALMQSAFSGDPGYHSDRRSLCLLFEADCNNGSLADLMVGDKESMSRQRAHFLGSLKTSALPKLLN